MDDDVKRKLHDLDNKLDWVLILILIGFIAGCFHK